jgi:hypothetical protein
MIPAIFLTVVMVFVILAIPLTLWYLVKIRKLHLPKEERKKK